MRELQVAGYDAEENRLVLTDSETQDEYFVTADDTLRAAARGDVPGFRQVKAEHSPAMRPSEIQELIRGGAAVEDLAAKAGMPRGRLDNLARPILMERANMVQRAQQSHPILSTGPSDITLAMAVHTGLAARGVAYHDATWDSWKTDGGHWVIELRWTENRADNTAHWRFQQDRSYAITSPIDEQAAEMTDPTFVPAGPRKVSSISNLGEARLRNSRTPEADRQALAVAAQRDAAGIPDGSSPSSTRRRTPGYSKAVTVNMKDLTAPTTPHPVGPQAIKTSSNQGEQLTIDNISPTNRPTIAPLNDAPKSKGAGLAAVTSLPVHDTPSAEDAPAPSDDTTDVDENVSAEPPAAAPVSTETAPAPSKRASRRKHPAMPSWEDVLLGVRGQDNE